ncbi:tyrosine-type recombinase/integrase [Alteriqipengyuania sp.]|uniref:tyrosine-type recombinase/integrase n=1 Tax=Alteriqipengyuania sp. TaxID=2800692 RepID=UPI003511DAF4
MSKVGVRDRLKCRREPYWQRLRIGCFLGYRPSKKDGPGTWIARAYDPVARRYQLRALGDLGELTKKEMFAAAKREAERHAETVEAGGTLKTRIENVADACRAYAQSRPEAEQRFSRLIYDDPLAHIKLEKLRRRHLLEWRSRLEQKPALVSRARNAEPVTRPRAASTVNRDMAVLRAALTKVLAPGRPNTEAAWQEALRAIPNADGRRTLYLDREQRRLLISHCDGEIEPFLRALCFLPLRPGALASLTVGDFDARTSELLIGRDKSGRSRRIKVPTEASALFQFHSEGKDGSEPMFRRKNKQAWDKNSWKRPIAAAVRSANLPHGATAYTLRHSTITDLVRAGLPLLTIAQISGTSAEMIERHYGHLVGDETTQALSLLAI